MVWVGSTLVVVIGFGLKTHFGQQMTLVFHLEKMVVVMVLVEDH